MPFSFLCDLMARFLRNTRNRSFQLFGNIRGGERVHEQSKDMPAFYEFLSTIRSFSTWSVFVSLSMSFSRFDINHRLFDFAVPVIWTWRWGRLTENRACHHRSGSRALCISSHTPSVEFSERCCKYWWRKNSRLRQVREYNKRCDATVKENLQKNCDLDRKMASHINRKAPALPSSYHCSVISR